MGIMKESYPGNDAFFKNGGVGFCIMEEGTKSPFIRLAFPFPSQEEAFLPDWAYTSLVPKNSQSHLPKSCLLYQFPKIILL